MGPPIIREHKPSMVHSKFCGLQSFNSKKILLALCVIAWAAIFFLSGTLFIRRRYESANEVGRTSYVTFCKILSPLLQSVDIYYVYTFQLYSYLKTLCEKKCEIAA